VVQDEEIRRQVRCGWGKDHAQPWEAHVPRVPADDEEEKRRLGLLKRRGTAGGLGRRKRREARGREARPPVGRGKRERDGPG
jgi:hypothetical protein